MWQDQKAAPEYLARKPTLAKTGRQDVETQWIGEAGPREELLSQHDSPAHVAAALVQLKRRRGVAGALSSASEDVAAALVQLKIRRATRSAQSRAELLQAASDSGGAVSSEDVQRAASE